MFYPPLGKFPDPEQGLSESGADFRILGVDCDRFAEMLDRDGIASVRQQCHAALVHDGNEIVPRRHGRRLEPKRSPDCRQGGIDPSAMR